MKKIIIYGNGKHAEQIAFLISYYRLGKVVSFTVEHKFITNKNLMNIPVIPFENLEDSFPPQGYDMFVAIGAQKMNQLREEIYYKCKAKGYSMTNLLCPGNNDLVASTPMGDNVFIDGSSFSSFIKLGNNVSFQGVNLGHHTEIHNHVLGAACIIGASCIIENNVLIGVGAIIAPGVKVGAYSFVSPGCIITKDVEPYSVYTNKSTQKRTIHSLRIK